MKNKSKLRKIKEKNNKAPACPKDWLYLNEQEITPRDIAEVFEGDGEMRSQLWEEAGVVEIEFPEAKSVDLEFAQLPVGDQELDDYFAKNQIKTVFFVTIAPEDYGTAKRAMEQIAEKLGGYFCGDTADFAPVVK